MQTDRRPRAATLLKLVALCLLATAASASAAVRVWTDDLNRTWQGDFLRVDGTSAVFLVHGKEYPFPMAHLSAPDKVVIFKLRQSPPAVPSPAPANNPASTPVPAVGSAAASGGTGKEWTFGDVKVVPGQTVETDLPILPGSVPLVMRSYATTTPPTHIRASLAVPLDFDGDKPQKLLVVSATASGDTLSIPVAKSTYTRDALAHGWVVLAADGPDGKPKHGDGPDYRLELLKAALVGLNNTFPKARTDWTVGTAGFSGGCGYAGHQALWFSTQGWRVGGVMMLNCNYPPTMWEHAPEMHGNTSHWHQIPMFISWGEKDTIATPAMMKEAINTTRQGGYQRVRVESHPGGHEAWNPHINLALDWFDSLLKGSGSGI